MSETIFLTRDDADDLLCLSEALQTGYEVNGLHYVIEARLPEVIEQKRWASIHRMIFRRVEDGTLWALDYEHSDSESHEDWSYIEPELRSVVAYTETVVRYRHE